MTRDARDVLQAAHAIRDERYPTATAVFAAGSLIRGDGTAYSDLDLVVVLPALRSAYRESFRFGFLPVEAFVHDPETLRYFFLEVDRRSGTPSLIRMVADGIAVPGPTEASRGFSQLARSTLAIGPPALTDEDRDRLRYAISDLLDDLRDPRTPTEQIATGTGLFGALADYYLRVHGFWSGRDKWIPRALEAANPELAVRYAEVFQWFFEDGDTASLIQLTEEILQPAGGPLFDGYRTDAPLDWRASHPAPDALPHESSTAADRPDPQID